MVYTLNEGKTNLPEKMNEEVVTISENFAEFAEKESVNSGAFILKDLKPESEKNEILSVTADESSREMKDVDGSKPEYLFTDNLKMYSEGFYKNRSDSVDGPIIDVSEDDGSG